MPYERLAVEIYSPAEADLIRRGFTGLDAAVVCTEVIHTVHDVARFDTRDIHGIEANRLNSVVTTPGHDGVVNLERLFSLYPDLITEIPGETRSRNEDVDIVELRLCKPEIAKTVQVRIANVLQYVARFWPLQ